MTRHHAKTFYFASHVLPAQKRSDAYAVYAFCRHVDDQIDLAPDEAGASAGLRRPVASPPRRLCCRRPTPNPWRIPCRGCAPFARRSGAAPFPRSYFEDLLAGVEMDRGRVRIADVGRAGPLLLSRRLRGRADHGPRPDRACAGIAEAGARSRHGDAIDQHPARHRGGLAAGPALSARGRTGKIRPDARRTSPSSARAIPSGP